MFLNYQAEFFGQLFPIVSDTLALNVEVVDIGGNVTQFNNTDTKFKLKISQVCSDSSSVASTDFCYAFYSIDSVYNLKNEYTSNSPINIKSALESFSLSRNENGELTLNLSARKQLLEDLGVVKPEIISNRPIKVSLEPRPPVLLTGLISFFATEIIYGQDTLFLTEVSPGDTLYANDGTTIGIVDYIVDDFELGLLSNFIGGTVEDIEFTNVATNEAFSIFEGYLSSPQIDYILGQNYDVYSNLSFSAICKKQHLNKMYFDTAPNFDNIKLPNIVEQAIFMGGSGNNDPNMIDLLASPTIDSYQVPINRSNSNRFTPEQKKQFERLKPESIVYISNIKAIGDDGSTRDLDPVSFKINPLSTTNLSVATNRSCSLLASARPSSSSTRR